MNKKGFTTVELILTVAVVIIIMGTISSVTYSYRDRSNYEENITDALNYKNSITKTVYDDILDIRDDPSDSKGKVVEIKELSNSYQFITETDYVYSLSVNNSGISYGPIGSELMYVFPGGNNGLVTLEDVNLNISEDLNFYRLDIYFRHKDIEDLINIHFIVSK